MTQICDKRVSFSLSLTKCTPQSVSLVLQRRRFHHTLLPGIRKGAKSSDSSEKVPNPDSSELHGSVVNHSNVNLAELLYCTDGQPLVKFPRKYCMRDEYGNLVSQKQKARINTSITTLPWNHMEGLKIVTLNVRSLKLGTQIEILEGLVTFSVDYIEIPNNVRLEVSEFIRCEWCTAHRLPAMFLQMTATACCCLMIQLAGSPDIATGYSSQGKNQEESHLSIIFESELTMLTKISLEEIFTQIGKLRNINNFLVKLTFEEAHERLKAHKHSQEKVQASPNLVSFTSMNAGCEMVTLSASESEEDRNELMESISLKCTQLSRKLVVYPLPPAKGGFSITEEDFSCLDEGEFLNDVIIDFYLKYLVCERLRKEDANRCHIFSSFFYKSLTQEDLMEQPQVRDLSNQKRRHNRVKTWTRHLDLFEKDFIFVPINQSSHWYLAVICFPGQASQLSVTNHCGNKREDHQSVFSPSPSVPNPMSIFYSNTSSKGLSQWNAFEGGMDEAFCISDDEKEDEVQGYDTSRVDVIKMADIPFKKSCILIMDSLTCGAKPAVVTVLQDYLEMEWLVKKGSLRSFGKGAMNGWSLQVPHQDNHTDCGLYLLQYVESFIMNPTQILHPAMDLSDWFPQKLVKKKRQQIKQLIIRLHQKYVNLKD